MKSAIKSEKKYYYIRLITINLVIKTLALGQQGTTILPSARAEWWDYANDNDIFNPNKE